MPSTSIDTTDAAELAELLQFLADWLHTDGEHLTSSLTTYVGNDAYNTTQLQADLHRFVFLLGGNDGEPLFQPDQQ